MGGLLHPLRCCVKHVFNENAIAGSGVVEEDVGNGSNQFSVLYDRRTGHVCVKYRTKFCSIFVRSVMNFVSFSFQTTPPEKNPEAL